jgi:hypothetical protein
VTYTKIHRLFKESTYDRLYGVNPTEGASEGYVLESADYFSLQSTAGGTNATVYRCLADGYHYLSLDPQCEVGVPGEGAVGQISTTHVANTFPIYRVRYPNGPWVITRDPNERQIFVNSGWTDKGMMGYAWN